jgi:hypothetical protein
LVSRDQFLVSSFYSILVPKLLNIETKTLFYFLYLIIDELKWNKVEGLKFSPYKPNISLVTKV